MWVYDLSFVPNTQDVIKQCSSLLGNLSLFSYLHDVFINAVNEVMIMYHMTRSSCSILMTRNRQSGCMWRVWSLHCVWFLNLMKISIKWQKWDPLDNFNNRFFHIYSSYLPFMRLKTQVWFSSPCTASLLRRDMIYLNRLSISSSPNFRISNSIPLVSLSLIIFVVIVVIRS